MRSAKWQLIVTWQLATLQERPRVLPRHSRRGRPLLGEAGVVKDQGPIAFGLEPQHDLDALAVEVGCVPGQPTHDVVELLSVGTRDDLGHRLAVLVRVLGEHSGDVALENMKTVVLPEPCAERLEKLGQFRQRFARRLGWSCSSFHDLESNRSSSGLAK